MGIRQIHLRHFDRVRCFAAYDGLTAGDHTILILIILYQTPNMRWTSNCFRFRIRIFDIMSVFLDSTKYRLFIFLHFDLDGARNEHIITQSGSREDKYSHHHAHAQAHAFSRYVSQTRASTLSFFIYVSTLRIPPISFSYSFHCIWLSRVFVSIYRQTRIEPKKNVFELASWHSWVHRMEPRTQSQLSFCQSKTFNSFSIRLRFETIATKAEL